MTTKKEKTENTGIKRVPGLKRDLKQVLPCTVFSTVRKHFQLAKLDHKNCTLVVAFLYLLLQNLTSSNRRQVVDHRRNERRVDYPCVGTRTSVGTNIANFRIHSQRRVNYPSVGSGTSVGQKIANFRIHRQVCPQSFDSCPCCRDIGIFSFLAFKGFHAHLHRGHK